MATISIITCFFNSEDYLEKYFDGIINQSSKDFELILINDGSIDQSDQIVQKYLSEQIKYIQLPQNLGTARARNIGIEATRGEFIFFVDSDDFISNNMVEEVLKSIDKEPNTAMFVLNLYKYYQERLIQRPYKTNLPEIFQVNQLEQHDFWRLFPRLGFRRDIIKEYNIRFPTEKLAQFDDYLFAWAYEIEMRSQYPNHKVQYLKQVKYLYRQRFNSSSLTDQALINYSANFKVMSVVFIPLIKQAKQKLSYIPVNLKNAIIENVFITLQRLLTLQSQDMISKLVTLNHSLKILKYLLLQLFKSDLSQHQFDSLFNCKNPQVISFVSTLLNLQPSKVTVNVSEYIIDYYNQSPDQITYNHTESKAIELDFYGYKYGTKIITPYKGIRLSVVESLMSNLTFMSPNKLDINTSYRISKGIIRKVDFNNYRKLISKIILYFTKTLIIDYVYFTDTNFISRVSYRLINGGFCLYVKHINDENVDYIINLIRNLSVYKTIISAGDSTALAKLRHADLCFERQIRILDNV